MKKTQTFNIMTETEKEQKIRAAGQKVSFRGDI